MKGDDRELGMHRAIHRRDFVNGTAVALGASLLPKWSWALALDAQAAGQPSALDDYPPAPHRHARQPRRVLRSRASDARRPAGGPGKRGAQRRDFTTWSWSAAG